MSDAEFKKEVLELGGTPPEFFEHPELLQIFLPMLKNDFRMAEQELVGELIPIEGDITVFLGKEDDLTPEQCDGWKLYTRQVCRMYYFEGGHSLFATPWCRRSERDQPDFAGVYAIPAITIINRTWMWFRPTSDWRSGTGIITSTSWIILRNYLKSRPFSAFSRL
jgi:hypothetical protein